MPFALVTTPESLSLLISRADARERLGSVAVVVVDEWHELLGTKRGVQVQLALARLRRWNPQLITWGLSATLGNVEEAMATLVGSLGRPSHANRAATLIHGKVDKTLVIDTLLPKDPGRFSWGGHLGAQMQDPVVEELDSAQTAIVFTNVRSQAEIWYQLLLERRPDWAGLVAVHHGSLDKGVREWVEAHCPAELRDRPTRVTPPEMKPWHRKLYERGWIAPHWPKEVGGMGATLEQQLILFEEIRSEEHTSELQSH